MVKAASNEKHYSMKKVLTHALMMNLLLLTQSGFAQSPAQQLDAYVDEFSGNFKYSVPLMVVPGPNGESFPLSANYYNGGIGMNQQASWIGLGWNLSVGQISRSTKGLPDDYNGASGQTDEWAAYDDGTDVDLIEDETFARECFGPIHFKELYDHFPLSSGYDERIMDLYVSRHGASGNEVSFEYPDYDDFHVSGPGIGGVMQPYMFDYANMYRPDANGLTYGDYSVAGYQQFHRKPQFRFRNEPGTRIYAPYYGRYDDWGTIPSVSYGVADQRFKTPYQLRPGQSFEDPGPPLGDTIPFMTGFSSNCAEDEWVKWGSNYVEYFLNKNIPSETDFMEYSTLVSRTSSQFVQEGIGAFRITTPSGMVYHYSLPVYTTKETTSDFMLDDDNDLEPVTNDADFPVKIYEKHTAYANSWKLTAITGQNYVDANNNGVVDNGDVGYWVAIEYEKWANTSSRSPFYGYYFDQRLKNHLTPEELRVWSNKDYIPRGTVNEADFEVYYPKRIVTASHMAYFVYDARLDNHGVDSDIPSLALTRLVLIDAEDEDVFDSPVNLTSTNFPNLGTHSGINNGLLVSENHYTNPTNQSAIESVSLQTVEFVQDNSLALGVYNNVLNTDISLGPIERVASVQGDLSAYHNDLYTPINSLGSPIANTGKLTLKEIKMFGDQHRSYQPSYKFEYADLTHNPNFDHEKKDFFGFYKRDYDHEFKGGYITESMDEHLHVDAWSLKKIITPLGGEISVDYESDVYHKVCYDAGTSPNWKFPKRIFRVKEMEKFQNSDFFEISLYNSDGYDYIGSQNVWKIGLGFKTTCSTPSIVDCESTLEGFDATDIGMTLNGAGDRIRWTGLLCGCTELYTDYHEDFGWGYIQFRLNEAYGGGIRVKQITLTEPELSESYTLDYEYGGGVVTTEPDRFTGVKNDGFSNTLLMSSHGSDRHARPPSVGYDKVSYKILGRNDLSMGKVVYGFNNYFNDLLPNHIQFIGPWMLSVVTVDDRSIAGRLKEKFLFDNQDVMVSKTSYEYSDPYLDKDNGLVEEVFYLRTKNEDDFLKRSVFRKRQITRYLKKTVSREGDKTYVNEVLERDPLTGITTLSKSTNPSDGVELSKSVMGYTTTSGLGSKHLNINNRNLVTGITTKYVYSEEEDVANIKNAVTSDWGNDFDYWDWDVVNDEYVRNTGFDKFLKEQTRVFNGESDLGNWKEASNITLLDATGRVIEKNDASGRYSATRFGYEDRRHVIATVQNSPFQGFTHSSFEHDYKPEVGIYYFEGMVEKKEGQLTTSNSSRRAHSGESYVTVTNTTENGPTFIIEKDTESGIDHGIEPGRTYIASVWVHNSSARYAGIEMLLEGTWTGGTSLSVKKERNDDGLVLGEWKRLEVQLTVPEDYQNNGSGNNDLRVRLYADAGVGYFDDMRVQPLDSRVEAMVFDKRTGWMTYSLNNDNVAIAYKYDPMGGVSKIYAETEDGFTKQLEIVENFGRDN